MIVYLCKIFITAADHRRKLRCTLYAEVERLEVR